MDTSDATSTPDTAEQGSAEGLDQARQPSGTQPAPAEDAQESPEATIARLTAENSKLRAENGKDRVNAKTQAAEEARNDLVQELGKALGLVKEGDKQPTAEELTTSLAQANEASNAQALQLAVFRAASKNGAHGDALLDSTSFLAAVKGLDPNDGEKIDAAIKSAVETNPRFRAAQAAARTSAEFNGGTGEPRNKPTTLSGAVDQYYLAAKQ
ncbi:hypothetical protein [Acaricomes phytoseiuli]|uniref:hypothetical protein n=1 Tax=Acaricomes phytoseiuli TaxID=291968 RepID=UPI00035C8D0F|nr:hypothetical protein [Acaricomes phytoseiuli]